jgi:hypothetical protein
MGVPLLSDEATVTLVALYALRRGISRNEALRRLVRTSLGVDPIGSWTDGRGKRQRTDCQLTAAVRRLRPSRARQNIPPAYEEMFLELKTKVGATEARRLTVEHAAVVAKRAQPSSVA